MSSLGSPNPFFIAGKKAYEVERSLRFNRSDSAHLTYTPASASSDRTKVTISAWVKKCGINEGEYMIAHAGTTNNNRAQLRFYTSSGFDNISFAARVSGSWILQLDTTAKFRDPNAWYHIVARCDTTNGTANIYINGLEETSFTTSTKPSGSQSLEFFNNSEHQIGQRGYDNTGYMNGYMAEINVIQGQALDASYFGETDAITGQWNPKKYTGGYGDGFYLNFSDNSGTTATTLGKDSSGNSNNFTPNNFAISDAVPDTPTNNFCTINAVGENLLVSGSTPTFSEGNLKSVLSGNGYGTYWKSTFGITSGKWYWEILAQNAGSFANIGIANAVLKGSTTGTGVFYQSNGYRNATPQANSTTSYGATYTTGDIIGIAFDADSESVTFYKNNSTQGAVGSVLTQANAPYFASVGDSNNGQQYTFTANFGQDSSFAGNKTAQGNADGSGQGDFYYAPPSGYKALCSANLPDPTILLPNQHFDTLLYTGDGSSGRSITGLEFSPDWVWIKRRNSTHTHNLYDTVRGATKYLASANTNVEGTESTWMTAFLSNGFEVGTGAPVNASSTSYVAWNWNGGDTDGKTYTVKVVDDSGNKYRFDDFGTSAVTLDLAEGGTYVFDWSDSSAQSHPVRFSTTSDGTHGGGSEYTTGVTKDDSAYKTTITVAASAPTLYYYCQNHSGMGGQANTNSTLGSSNFDGNNQSTVKVNATAGFSIVSYTGNGTNSSNVTMGHGLGVKPDAVFIKNRDNAYEWVAWINGVGGSATDNQKNLQFNATTAAGQNSSQYRTSDSTTIAVRDTDSNGNGKVNKSGDDYISYVFSSVSGYSKHGSYEGNGSSDGTFVFTGHKVAFLILKGADNSDNWFLIDNKRDTFNVCDDLQRPNLNQADFTFTTVDFLSNGFKIRSDNSAFNTSGNTYVYLSFAESPFKNARAR